MSKKSSIFAPSKLNKSRATERSLPQASGFFNAQSNQNCSIGYTRELTVMVARALLFSSLDSGS